MADSDELGRRLTADVDSSSSNNLFQVMRAVEDAEATIRQQLEENSRLKDELMLKTRELDRIDRIFEAYGNTFSSAAHGNKTEASKWFSSTSSSPNPQSTLASHQNGHVERGEQMLQDAIKLKYLDGNQSNGILRKLSGEQSAAESGVPSQLSTPSSRSISPARHRKEGEYDSRFNLAGQGLLPVSEMNSNIILKQDLLAKVKEHEEEIAQLRKHLADYSVKEAQILNEKHVLEKRIAYMRMAFDQQQQDLVDAASKALSYRQDIIEENIRLTYALQALIECDGDSIDLSGDIGAVGKIVISNGPTGNQDLLLDLKGTIYKSTIVPSRTFCVVSVGQTEPKIEAIMNDFIQLEPQSNLFEVETMMEVTLDGFTFDSNEEGYKRPESHAYQNDQNNDDDQPKAKTKSSNIYLDDQNNDTLTSDFLVF